jgi:hypothetical protein
MGPAGQSQADSALPLAGHSDHARTTGHYEGFCQAVFVVVKGPESGVRAAQSTGRFTIQATFHSNVTARQRAVILQAVDEWEAFMETRGFTPANYPITFSNGSLPDRTLGQTTTSYWDTGNLQSAAIVFNDDPATGWFVDPTPADDTEFEAGGPDGIDLLTVARHEIAHALGWGSTPRVTSLLNGAVFDPDRLNIATTYPDSFHADPDAHVDDLMIPSIRESVRRSISVYPDGALLARAFHYDIVCRFVDRGYSGIGHGSANAPWTTLLEGINLTPLGYHVLLVPRAYAEPVPLVLDEPLTMSAARGGDAVIGSSRQP